MSFAAYTLQVPATDILQTLQQAPAQFAQVWQEHAGGDGAALVKQGGDSEYSSGLVFLCHQADTELMYGLKLREVEPKAYLSWQALAGQLPPTRRALAAQAALEGFTRLRQWNLEFCESHTLSLKHFGVLNAIAQQDVLRLEQLKTVLSSTA